MDIRNGIVDAANISTSTNDLIEDIGNVLNNLRAMLFVDHIIHDTLQQIQTFLTVSLLVNGFRLSIQQDQFLNDFSDMVLIQMFDEVTDYFWVLLKERP